MRVDRVARSDRQGEFVECRGESSRRNTCRFRVHNDHVAGSRALGTNFTLITMNAGTVLEL